VLACQLKADVGERPEADRCAGARAHVHRPGVGGHELADGRQLRPVRRVARTREALAIGLANRRLRMLAEELVARGAPPPPRRAAVVGGADLRVQLEDVPLPVQQVKLVGSDGGGGAHGCETIAAPRRTTVIHHA
jgi:hypothetical protein